MLDVSILFIVLNSVTSALTTLFLCGCIIPAASDSAFYCNDHIYDLFAIFSFPLSWCKALILKLVKKADGVSWDFNLCLFEPFTRWIQNQLEIKHSPDLLGSTAEMICMTNVLFVHVNMLLVHTHTQAFHVSPQGRACCLLVTSLNSMEKAVFRQYLSSRLWKSAIELTWFWNALLKTLHNGCLSCEMALWPLLVHWCHFVFCSVFSFFVLFYFVLLSKRQRSFFVCWLVYFVSYFDLYIITHLVKKTCLCYPFLNES